MWIALRWNCLTKNLTAIYINYRRSNVLWNCQNIFDMFFLNNDIYFKTTHFLLTNYTLSNPCFNIFKCNKTTHLISIPCHAARNMMPSFKNGAIQETFMIWGVGFHHNSYAYEGCVPGVFTLVWLDSFEPIEGVIALLAPLI